MSECTHDCSTCKSDCSSRDLRVPANAKSSIKHVIAVDSGKETILYGAGVEEPGARFMHFPVGDDRGYDLEFFRGLLSEKQMLVRRRGQNVITWEKVHERNEPLDCRNYA